MFEKNRAANITSASSAIHVRLTLADGTVLSGAISSYGNGRTVDILNGGADFVEFTTSEGTVRYFNKSMLLSIEPVDVPKADQLKRRNAPGPVFDPYQVLSIEANAPVEEARAAYHALAQAYHPDRLQTLDLPDEVRAYMLAMSQRINLAWETVSCNAA